VKPARKSDPAWLLAPMLLALGVFFVYPLLSALHSSFFVWDLLTPPRYVGLANYSAILESGELVASLGTTLLISAIVVAGSMLLGRGLALAEVTEVRDMARRIAAPLLLQPALDANYRGVKAAPYPWTLSS